MGIVVLGFRFYHRGSGLVQRKKSKRLDFLRHTYATILINQRAHAKSFQNV